MAMVVPWTTHHPSVPIRLCCIQAGETVVLPGTKPDGALCAIPGAAASLNQLVTGLEGLEQIQEVVAATECFLQHNVDPTDKSHVCIVMTYCTTVLLDSVRQCWKHFLQHTIQGAPSQMT